MKQFLSDRNARAFVGRHQALLGFIASLVIMGGTIAYVARESARTTRALCALRGDLEARIEQSKGFLVEHPEGVAGVSAKVIQDGIRNQQRTVHALRGLPCS